MNFTNEKIITLKKWTDKNNNMLTKITAVLMIIVGLNNIRYVFNYVGYLFDDIVDAFRYGLDIWMFIDLLYTIEFITLSFSFIFISIILFTNKYKISLKYLPFVLSAGYMVDVLVELMWRILYSFDFSGIVYIVFTIALAAVWMCIALEEKIFNQNADKRVLLIICAIAVVVFQFIKMLIWSNAKFIVFILILMEYALTVLFVIIKPYVIDTNNKENGSEMTENTNYTYAQINESAENIAGYLKIWKLIVFSILTLGIYTYIWIYRTVGLFNNKKIGEEKSQGLQVVLCLLVPFYAIYWLYKQSKQTEEYTLKVGNASNDLSIISLILSIFGFGLIAMALIQDQINKNVVREHYGNYGDSAKSYNNSVEKNTISQSEIISEKTTTEQESKNDRISDVDIEYLKKIKDLYDMGILTEEEYQSKKKNVLK